jgi:site-specific recombinase XerD
LPFLYREVLAIDFPWLIEVQRPTRPRRIPSLLTKAEVAALLGTALNRHFCALSGRR